MTYVWKHSPYRGVTRLIHLAIADSVSDDHGNLFFMSVERLAERKVKCSRSTAFDAVAKMIEDGHLEVVERHEKRPTVYRFLMPGAESGDWTLDSNTRDPRTEHARSPDSTRAATAREPNRSQGDPNRARAEPLPISDALEEEFARWWKLYPRKVARAVARKAYEAARRAGASSEDLHRAVVRYAEARVGEDPKFTLHAATFLRQDRWRDSLPAPGAEPEWEDDEWEDPLRRLPS